MAERMHGVPAPATTSTVRGEDWYGRELTGEAHDAVAFYDVDLTEVQTRHTSFSDCTFRSVKFNASEHTDSAFLNCTFVRCSFFDASFTACKLMGSLFDGCTFDLVKARGGDWSFVGLPGADLTKAAFHDVRMREADLTGARCHGATLRGLDLSGAALHGADLTDCDLRGSDLASLDPLTVQRAGAVVGIDQAVVIAEALGFDVRPT